MTLQDPLQPAPPEAHGEVLTARSVTIAGFLANAALTVAKIAAGILFNSRTILADGLHSGSDLVTDAAVLASLSVSEKPADRCHPYGHRRVSTLTGLFVGAMLFLAAVWIGYDAIVSLNAPHGGVFSLWPLAVALSSIPVKELLYQATRWVGRKTNNMALLANAWHHRTDAFSSIAAAIGLAGVAIGGEKWQFLDHLTAVVLAAFLLVVAVKLMIQAGGELVDRAPSAATLEGLRRALAETEGVQSYHAFRARRIGGKLEMDVHVQVDADLTVAEGHDIASAVKHRVMETDADVIEVIVHIEPVEEGEVVTSNQ